MKWVLRTEESPAAFDSCEWLPKTWTVCAPNLAQVDTQTFNWSAPKEGLEMEKGTSKTQGIVPDHWLPAVQVPTIWFITCQAKLFRP